MTDVFPLAVWASGTNENSLPANDNSLRLQAILSGAISKSTTAQPGSPSDGDLYIIPAGATGTQWATFAENDVAIFMSGTWYAVTPVFGVRIIVADHLEYFDGSDWVEIAGGGGGGTGDDVNVLSIASGVVNIDCSMGNYFTLSLTANVTSITFSNLPASGKAQSIAIRIRQDGTGGRTVALPSSFKATGGSDTAVQSSANAYTMLTISTFDQGTRWEYAMQEIAA